MMLDTQQRSLALKAAGDIRWYGFDALNRVG